MTSSPSLPPSAGSPRRVVVVGGGISGLSAAYRLTVGAAERGLPIELSLLDVGEQPGGVISTADRDGFVMEEGPDCFLSIKPAATALCKELGLDGQIIGTNPNFRQSFVVRDGRLHPLPEGFYLLAPSKFWPFVTTPIISWPGKLRMGLDLLLPRRRGGADESLADFVLRRLGREALDRLAQPMVGGIYTADPAMLSLRATMPQFLEMEEQHRSVIWAMWKARVAREKSQRSMGQARGPRYDLFLTLRGGLSQLIGALLRRLPPGTVRSRARVTGMAGRPGGGFALQVEGQPPVEADAVCLAVPAYVASKVMGGVDAAAAGELAGIQYASSIVVHVNFNRQDVPHPLDGMGFVVPAIENRTLLACSFSSNKFEGRAPEGQALFRCFCGGAMRPDLWALSDTSLVDAILRDLRELLGIEATPRFAMVSRHQSSMAQYNVGHLDRVARIEGREQLLPGLALAGNAFRGVGMGDCIASGNRAAERLLDYLSAQRPG